MFLPLPAGVSASHLPNTKRHIVNGLICDKLVRAVRFRTPLLQIRTPEHKHSPGTRNRIFRIQFAGCRPTGVIQKRASRKSPWIASPKPTSGEFRLRLTNRSTRADFRGAIVRLEAAKSSHKVLDLAGRPGFAGFKVALDA